MTCTPCGRSIPDIIRLARREPKLFFCPECMSVWTPEQVTDKNCPECPECGDMDEDALSLEDV